MPDDHPLSADQLEQAGRILTPTVKEALRGEFSALQDSMNKALVSQTDELRECIRANADAHGRRLDGHEVRIVSLESTRAAGEIAGRAVRSYRSHLWAWITAVGAACLAVWDHFVWPTTKH